MKKVLCFGTFDILHDGHEEFLKDCKKQGDYLIVNVISDGLVYKNKNKFPVNSQKTRVSNLESLKIADQVIAVSDDDDKNLDSINDIRPDVIAVGYDQRTKFIDRLKEFLRDRELNVNYYFSREFADGIHSSHLR